MDYYSRLGLQRGADSEDIRKAFRRQALIYHPDKHNGDDTLFKELLHAYNTLRDNRKRDIYDANTGDSVPVDLSGVIDSSVERPSQRFRRMYEDSENEFRSYNVVKVVFEHPAHVSLHVPLPQIPQLPPIETVVYYLAKFLPPAKPVPEALYPEFVSEEKRLEYVNALFAKRKYMLALPLLSSTERLTYALKITDPDVKVEYYRTVPGEVALVKLLSIRPHLGVVSGLLSSSLDPRTKAKLQLLLATLQPQRYWHPRPKLPEDLAAIYDKQKEAYLEALLRRKPFQSIEELLPLTAETMWRIKHTKVFDTSPLSSLLQGLVRAEFASAVTTYLLDSEDLQGCIRLFRDTNILEVMSTECVVPNLRPPVRSVSLSGMLQMICRWEKSVRDDKLLDVLECAFTWIDLGIATRAIDSIIVCFIKACLCLVTRLSVGNSDRTAYTSGQLLAAISAEVFMLTIRHASCSMAQLVYNFLIWSIQQIRFCSNETATLLKSIVKECWRRRAHLSRVAPFIVHSFGDAAGVIVDNFFVQRHLLEYMNVDVAEAHKRAYYLYEASLQGWNDEDKDSLRLNATRQLLLERGWNEDMFNAVFAGLHPPFAPERQFSRFSGFRYDLKAGKLQFFFEEDKAKIISFDEVLNVLTTGAPACAFTLDQPDAMFSKHPCQLMRYSPDTLTRTVLLQTLLEADYILKEMSCGAITSKIPPHTVSTKSHLVPCVDSPSGEAHRFWIENKSVDVETTSDASSITVTYGKVSMVVKQHLLELDKQGNLVDSTSKQLTRGDEVFEEKETSESTFAANMTREYDAVAKSQPCFARLQEMVKIQYCIGVLMSIRDSLTKRDANDHNNIAKFLARLDQFTYPQYSSYKVEQAIDEATGYNRSKYTDSAISNARQDIAQKLQEADRSMLNSIVTSVYSQFEVSVTVSNVQSYLVGRSSALRDSLSSGLDSLRCAQFQKIDTLFGRLGIPKTPPKFEMTTDPVCSYVPAVNTGRVYGGVVINPNPRAANDNLPPTRPLRYVEYGTADGTWGAQAYASVTTFGGRGMSGPSTSPEQQWLHAKKALDPSKNTQTYWQTSFMAWNEHHWTHHKANAQYPEGRFGYTDERQQQRYREQQREAKDYKK